MVYKFNMIKLNFGQLNQSWAGIQAIAHSRIPAGAFRVNVRLIIEQLSAEYDRYQREFSDLALEFCVPVEGSNDQYQRPKEREKNLVFTERLDQLYKVEIEVKGNRLDLSEVQKFCNLSIAEEIILSRWLFEEFPSEVPEDSRNIVS